MRIPTRRFITLCSGLAILAACDSTKTPLAPSPEGPTTALGSSAGLVAFYSFDQDAGNATVTGATHVATGGYQGGAFQFDGNGDHIDLPVNVNPSVRPRVTMGAWMRAASLPVNRSAQILSHDNGGWDRSIALDQRGLNRWMPIDGKHRVSAFMGDGVVPGTVVDTARWTFVAAVYDETSVTLYVDGQAYTSPAWNREGFSFLRVGGSPGALQHGEAFHGTIDNVFVYDRALSADEIAAIRTGGACAVTATCEAPRRVAFYPFDTGAGDGTVRGAAHQPAGGYEGGAYYFDGTGAHIDLPVNVNPSVMPRATMGAWVRAASLSSRLPAQVLSHDDGAWDRSITLDPRRPDGWTPPASDYRVSAFTGGGLLQGPVAEAGAWIFVAAVYDAHAGSVTLYADGTVTGTYGLPAEGLDFLRVGANPAGAPSGEPFHGWIDNVFVVNRALSANEIAAIRAGGACAVTGTCEAPRRMAFYPFDTGAGDGTVRGATHQAAGGYQGGAYYFNGAGSHIDLPVDVSPSKMPRATMGAWVRTASLPAHPVQVLSHDNAPFDRSIALDQRGPDGATVVDGRHRVAAFTGTGPLPGSVARIGEWTFVAAVYDETSVTLYVDGERYHAQSRTGEGMPFLRVGDNPMGREAFHGWIDNVFVVNRALSAGEIAAVRGGGACVLAGTPCNRAPAVQAGGAYAAAEGSPVALELAASDPDGDALSLAWNLGDGTAGTGAFPAWHTYAENGTYTVTVTATDPAGLSATASATVQIANVRPTVLAFAGASLLQGERYGAAVSFTDPGADRWTGAVDYGDGSGAQPLVLSGRSAVLAHTYAAPGTYVVRVNVRDDDDATPGTATATVVVVGVTEGMARASRLVAQALAAGELEAEAARRVTERLGLAATFLGRADSAPVRQQEVAMLNIVLRHIDTSLELLSGGGQATVAARQDLVRVRAVVQARLDAITR